MNILSEVKQFKALCDDLKVGDSFSMYFSPLEDTITVSLTEELDIVGYTDNADELHDWSLVVRVDSTKSGFYSSYTDEGDLYIDAFHCVKSLIRDMQK